MSETTSKGGFSRSSRYRSSCWYASARSLCWRLYSQGHRRQRLDGRQVALLGRRQAALVVGARLEGHSLLGGQEHLQVVQVQPARDDPVGQQPLQRRRVGAGQLGPERLQLAVQR